MRDLLGRISKITESLSKRGQRPRIDEERKTLVGQVHEAISDGNDLSDKLMALMTTDELKDFLKRSLGGGGAEPAYDAMPEPSMDEPPMDEPMPEPSMDELPPEEPADEEPDMDVEDTTY